MSDVAERSSITTEVLDWSEAEGKHAQMHLIRRATLMALDQVIERVGIDESESSTTIQNTYRDRRQWQDSLKRPHEIIHRGHGKRFIATNMVALGEIDDPEKDDRSYRFARIEESGRFIFEEISNRFHNRRQPRSQHDTYYRPDFEITYFAGPRSGTAEFAHEIQGSSIRMMEHPNSDVRFHTQWSPEDMTTHYEGQIGQLIVFLDRLTEIAQASGAYIHYCTDLRYFLDKEEVARHRGI